MTWGKSQWAWVSQLFFTKIINSRRNTVMNKLYFIKNLKKIAFQSKKQTTQCVFIKYIPHKGIYLKQSSLTS